MNKNIVPPDWGSYDPNMFINLSDMQYYYENFTNVVNETAEGNSLKIETLDGRVAKLEQEQPVGPGGTGAFLNLGGVPERYPTAEEMVAGGNETGFMVIARSDGIYFYNPVTKQLIKPKQGGGTIAVHGQLPMIYDLSHSLQHNGRAGASGIYTAKVGDVGLGSWTAQDTCKILVVTTAEEEYQTAMGKDGFASRVFKAGELTATWGFFTGGSGGSGIDPAVIDEINRRLDDLEKYDHSFKITDLTDVKLDPILDVNGLLYMDDRGEIRGGNTNPMLSMGYTHTHTNGVGAPSVISINNVSSTVVASNNIIILTATATRTVTLPTVVPYNAFKPTTTQVREGRTTFIVNMSNFSQTVRVSPAHMFYIEGSMDSTNAVVPPKTVFVYNPALLDNGSGVTVGCWVYMGNYQLRASDMSTVMQELQELQSKTTLHDTQIAGLASDIQSLANAPKPKFIELSDTPSGYQPGKLVGYNLSGTAMIAVDPINQLKAMTDTPNDYTGHARKTLTVKQDESGMEFTPFPDVNGIITDVNNLHNDMIAVNNRVTTTNGNVTALGTRVDALENSSGGGSGVTQADLLGPNTPVSGRNHFSAYHRSNATATREHVGRADFIMMYGSTTRQIQMPHIVAKDGDITTEAQCREGKIYYLQNQSTTVDMQINRATGQSLKVNFADVGNNLAIPPNTTEIWKAGLEGTTGVWYFIGRLANR